MQLQSRKRAMTAPSTAWRLLDVRFGRADEAHHELVA
jgi:hypothetical protein